MDAASDMIFPILPIFITSVLGAPVAAVGLIEGIADSASSILKTISGWLSDRFKRRKPLVILGYSIAAISKPLIALSTVWSHVLGLKFIDRIGKGIRTAPRDAMIAESSKKRGRAFGIQRALDNAGAIMGTFITFVLLYYGITLRSIILLTAIPAVISVIVLFFFVKEKKSKAKHSRIKLSIKPFSRRYKMFLAVSAIFGVANFSYAFFILRAQELGIALAFIPVVYMLYSLFASVFSVPAGGYSDKIGKKNMITIGWLIFALLAFGFMIADNPAYMWVLFAGYGIFHAINDAVSRAFVADMVPLKYEGTAIGTYHTTIGLTALPASLIAGLLWDIAGSEMTFLFASSIALLAAVLFFVFVPRLSAR